MLYEVITALDALGTDTIEDGDGVPRPSLPSLDMDALFDELPGRNNFV